MPLILQARRDLVGALRHPKQSTFRIAKCHRLNDAFQVREQRHIALAEQPRPATSAPDLARIQPWRIKILQSAHDGAARQPGDLRHSRQPAPAGNTRLARGKQPPSALVALRAVQFPPLPNRLDVNHP